MSLLTNSICGWQYNPRSEAILLFSGAYSHWMVNSKIKIAMIYANFLEHSRALCKDYGRLNVVSCNIYAILQCTFHLCSGVYSNSWALGENHRPQLFFHYSKAFQNSTFYSPSSSSNISPWIDLKALPPQVEFQYRSYPQQVFVSFCISGKGKINLPRMRIPSHALIPAGFWIIP